MAEEERLIGIPSVASRVSVISSSPSIDEFGQMAWLKQMLQEGRINHRDKEIIESKINRLRIGGETNSGVVDDEREEEEDILGWPSYVSLAEEKRLVVMPSVEARVLAISSSTTIDKLGKIVWLEHMLQEKGMSRRDRAIIMCEMDEISSLAENDEELSSVAKTVLRKRCRRG